MENINKNPKPKKSQFIHKNILPLNKHEELYLENLNKILENKSEIEIIGYIPNSFSHDNIERPLFLSREIIDKIESDHGKIYPENIIINVHRWENATTNVLGNPDKINIIKYIPNSDNYLLIAAVRINGYYMVTHFEIETYGNTNLKRLLSRGNVISRGPSIGL